MTSNLAECTRCYSKEACCLLATESESEKGERFEGLEGKVDVEVRKYF